MGFGKQSNQVLTTKDYSIFKIMDGNREYEKHGKKLIGSVKRFGIICPIVVNERMEIVDGQGRYYAAAETGAEVPYIVCKGLNVEACVEMNTTQRSWGQNDYIRSYAARGVEPYMEIEAFMAKYPGLSSRQIWYALKGHNIHEATVLRQGRFKPHKNAQKHAPQALEFLHRVLHSKFICKHIPGRKHQFFEALFLMLGMGKEVNKKRLLSVLERHIQNPDIFPPFNNLDSACRSVESAYNYGAKKDEKVNLTGRKNDIAMMGLTWWGDDREE